MEFTLQQLEEIVEEAKARKFPPTTRIVLHQPDAKSLCDVLSPLRHVEYRKSQVFINEDGPNQDYREKLIILSPKKEGVQ